MAGQGSTNRFHRSRPIVLAALGALALGACSGSAPDDPAAVSAQRVADLRAAAGKPINDLKASACKSAEAEAALTESVRELVGRHGATPGTHRALREIAECGCPSVQMVVVIAVRELRPYVEGKPAPADLVEILAIGLASPDAKLRTHAAMSVYELHADPRGTRADDLLNRIAETDLDDKPRQTAAWVREQIAKQYSGK